MQGVSTIIVIVLLVIIIVSIVGLSYTFFTSILSTTTQAAQTTTSEKVKELMKQVRILSMSLNDVYIRNTGLEDISEVDVIVDEGPVNYVLDPPVIESERIGTVKILDFIKEGDEVKIGSGLGMVSIEAPDPCDEAVLCLDFDEDSGSFVEDTSGNTGNHGTLGQYLNQTNNADSTTRWESHYTWNSEAIVDDDKIEGSKSIRLNDTVLLNSTHYHLHYDLPAEEDWSNYEFLTFYIKVIDKPSFHSFTFDIETYNSTGGSCSWHDCNIRWTITNQIIDNEWTKIYINLSNPSSEGPLVDNSRVHRIHFYGPTKSLITDVVDADYLVDDIWVGNSSVWVSGKYGSALSFDGQNDYVNISDSTSLDLGTEDFTVSIWVKHKTITSHAGYITKGVSHRLHNSDAPAFVLRHGYSPTYETVFYIDDGANQAMVNCVDELGDDQWHHVVGVREGNTIKLFVDGNLKNTTDASAVGSINNDDPLVIGRQTSSGGIYLNGIIDEVRIYNKAIY